MDFPSNIFGKSTPIMTYYNFCYFNIAIGIILMFAESVETDVIVNLRFYVTAVFIDLGTISFGRM